MADFDKDKLVKALREIAAKAKHVTETTPQRPRGGYSTDPLEPIRTDTYTREWIIGSIEGLAYALDTLE